MIPTRIPAIFRDGKTGGMQLPLLRCIRKPESDCRPIGFQVPAIYDASGRDDAQETLNFEG